MPRLRKPKTCKHCGKSGLWWKNIGSAERGEGSNWRLMESDNATLHNCTAKRARARAESIETEIAPEPESTPEIDMTTQHLTDLAQEMLEVDNEGTADTTPDTTPDPKPQDAGDALYALLRGHVVQDITSKLAKHTPAFDAKTLLDQVSAVANGAIDNAISKYKRETADTIQLTRLDITIKDRDEQEMIKIEGAHPCFEQAREYIEAGENVALVGPAGTGKTTAAEMIAKALGLEFYPLSVGPQTSKSDLVGYSDAHGRPVRTPFWDAFEYGGLCLLDELDAGHAGVLTQINSPIANKRGVFGGSTIIKGHEKFRLIAALNTFGMGASAQYVGRNQLDAATRDRFTWIKWGYDVALEQRIAAEYGQLDWCQYVHKVRKIAETNGLRVVVSTRAIISGARLLARGRKLDEVRAAVLFDKMSTDDVAKINANLK